MFAVRVGLGLILGAWLVLYAVNPPWLVVFMVPLPGWLRWAGFGLGLASLSGWVWTQVALRAAWSPQLQLRPDHQLVTTGPYARIRHPLYTAMSGYVVSLALVTADWEFILFAAAAIGWTAARMPKEEQMMLERFGETYQAYMRRTGRYFPKFHSE